MASSVLSSQVGHSLRNRPLNQLRAMFANMTRRGLLASHVRFIKAAVGKTIVDVSNPDDTLRSLKGILMEGLRNRAAKKLQLDPSQLIDPSTIPLAQLRDVASDAYLNFGPTAHKVLGRSKDQASTFVYESLPVADQTASWLTGEADNIRDTLKAIAKGARKAGTEPITKKLPSRLTKKSISDFHTSWYITPDPIGIPKVSRAEIRAATKLARQVEAGPKSKEFLALADKAHKWANIISPRTIGGNYEKIIREESRDLTTRLLSEPGWLKGRAQGESSAVTALIDKVQPISPEVYLQRGLDVVSRKIQAAGARKIKSYGPKVSKKLIHKLNLHTKVWRAMVNEITIDDAVRRALIHKLNTWYYPKLREQSRLRRQAYKKLYERFPKPPSNPILDSL